MKKTKIVCTLGPATDDKKMITHLIASGMNVARLNFSHGSHEEQKKRIDMVKEIRDKLDAPIAIMLDTKGPEIRITQFKDKKIVLKEGSTFTLRNDDELGDESSIPTTYKDLYKEVKKGDTILIDDGLIKLTVREIDGENVVCRVDNGGELSNNKSINIPNVNIKLPAITAKDEADLIFGIENNIDYIAASFIRSKDDVLKIRRVLEENGGEDIHIISKIENHRGVENIQEIIEVSDGIMVARGDLGVEIPAADVPIVQKDIIYRCNKVGKPVITATQMLDSMIKNPRATRAEVTDVANAIFDGTDAVMLSGETAAGKYPIEAVQTMCMIAEKTEKHMNLGKHYLKDMDFIGEANVTSSISYATYSMAKELKASAIITPTGSGYTARMVSKFRPSCQIIAYTDKEYVRRRLSLIWGVEPLCLDIINEEEELYKEVVRISLEKEYIKEGDLAIITAGLPLGVKGTTNSIRVETVGEYVYRGVGIGTKRVRAKFRIFKEDTEFEFHEGDILALEGYSKKAGEYIKRAGGVVTTESGLSCDVAIAAISCNVSALVGIDTFKGYENGEDVVLDPYRGLLYKRK